MTTIGEICFVALLKNGSIFCHQSILSMLISAGTFLIIIMKRRGIVSIKDLIGVLWNVNLVKISWWTYWSYIVFVSCTLYVETLSQWKVCLVLKRKRYHHCEKRDIVIVKFKIRIISLKPPLLYIVSFTVLKVS